MVGASQHVLSTATWTLEQYVTLGTRKEPTAASVVDMIRSNQTNDASYGQHLDIAR